MAHKIGRSFKKEILDDALGIDENKTFGISNKTFVGKGLAKVTPGGKNNIFGQVGDFVEDKVTQPVKEGVGALGALVTGKAARDAELQALRDQQTAVDKQTAEGNRMALASDLISRGKGAFFDITRPESVENFLMDKEGEYMDPFPDYLRKSGDFLLEGLEGTAENLENYTGTPDELMAGFQPTYDKLQGAQDSAVDRLQSIYDGRMENKLQGFNDQSDQITQDLKGINLNSADYIRDLEDKVINAGEAYADSLANSVNTQADLARQEFDARRGFADQEFDARRRFADQQFDVRGTGARALAAAQRSAAGDMARAAARGLGGMQGGTGQNMANAMIASSLGQQQAGALAQNIIDNESARYGALGNIEGARYDKLGDIEGGRYEKLGDINPGMADVYRNEALLGNANTRLGFGDVLSQAQAENLGLDQGMIDADKSLYNSIMGQQLSNVGMIPSMGLQKAMLPSLFGEAALAPQGPLASKVSPYTSTGTLPAGNTNYTAQPYIPPSDDGNIFDTIGKIPGYIDKGKKVMGALGGLFGGNA